MLQQSNDIVFSIIIPITSNDNDFDLIGCLESIKQQNTDHKFEVICVCYKNIEYYKEIIENKFRYKCILCPEKGYCECLNYGIKNSKGRLIIPLKSNSILKPDALTILYRHRINDVVYISDHFVDIDSLYNINIILIKRSTIESLPYLFEQYYFPCHNEKFFLHCKFNNIETTIINENLFYIVDEFSNQRSNKIDNILYNINNSDSRELTCIIPFKNEKTEVERTILSIYSTSKNTNIVVINDCSDDRFDYSFIKHRFPKVKYIENKLSIGHGNIDLGVVNSESKYCILLDAHMRFFEQDWDNRILDILKSNPDSLVYCNTTIMHNNDGIYYNEDNSEKIIPNIGAKVNLDPTSTDNVGIFQHRWSYKSKEKLDNIHITPNVLGACYAFSSEHYWNIGGTYGLLQYGLSEATLAVKTWLIGGKVYRIQDLYVGHVYRNKFPYEIGGYSSFLNDRFLINLYIQDSPFKDKCLEFSKSRLNNDRWKQQYDMLWNKQESRLLRYIKHYQSKFIYDINWFIDNINNKFD